MGGIRTVVLIGWIVWIHAVSSDLGKDIWRPTRAVETLAECQEVIDISLTNTAAQTARATRTGNVMEVTLPEGARAWFAGVCLPENIDPRR